VFVGTSVIRGIFLTALDKLFPSEDLSDESKFWKCWGFLDAQSGSLRLSYRDVRWPLYDRDAEYASDADSFIISLLNEQYRDQLGPDYVVVEDLDSAHEQAIFQWISGVLRKRPEWNGTFLVGPALSQPWWLSNTVYESYAARFAPTFASLPSVKLYDIAAMSQPMLHTMEYPLAENFTFQYVACAS